MAVERTLEAAPAHIAVVDDVVTRGATLMSAISRVKEAFPEAEVAGFALVRTMSDGEVARIGEPCVGEITVQADECFRRP